MPFRIPAAIRVTPIRLLSALTLTLCVARQSHAQADRIGRIEGTVTDSIHSRPLAGVRVAAVDAAAPATMPGSATTDARGSFRIDSLAPGRYMVGFESPLLDSLEIALPPREVTGSRPTSSAAMLYDERSRQRRAQPND